MRLKSLSLTVMCKRALTTDLSQCHDDEVNKKETVSFRTILHVSKNYILQYLFNFVKEDNSLPREKDCVVYEDNVTR